jgi:modification methylase
VLHFKILIGNSNNIPAIESNSIHFIFTSPPYSDVLDYNRSDPENIGNYKQEEYLNLMRPVYKENFRVLKPGRKMIVNIADTVESSEIDQKMTHYRYGDKTLHMLEEIGFIYEDEIIWDLMKSRSQNLMGGWPYPGSVIFLHGWEHCYILRKPGQADWAHVTEQEKEAAKLSSDFIYKYSYNIWPFRTEAQESYHPAPFPISLVKTAIQVFTYPNEIVYDCFGGTGTTMRASKDAQRSAIITELGYNAKDGRPWLEHTKERVGWGDSNLASDEILYRVLKTTGEEIESQDVKGEGRAKLFEKSGTHESSLFKFGLEVETKHGEIKKENKVQLPEGEYEWDKNKEWKKQKVL